MMRRLHALIALMIAIAVLQAGCRKAEQPSGPAGESSPVEPRLAVPFKIRTFEGKYLSTDEMKGKLVVLNFFASWCGPCRIEAPGLQDAYSELKGTGVEFVAVAVDDSDEGARGFLKRYRLTFPAGRDASGDIMKAYNIYGIPKTYLIGRDGSVLFEHSGVISREDLVARIRKEL